MKKIYLQEAKTQIARPTNIRDINKRIVLNYIRARSPISRADIARETELQRSTVSSIVEGLQKDGLVEEIGSGDSTGGRKPTMYKLKTGKAVALGIDIRPKETTIAVADLAGEILQQETFPTTSDMDFMTQQILEKTLKYIEEYQEKELEIGISIPGLTDQTQGIVHTVPYFNWHQWEIQKIISEATSLKVTIENDANANALAELWFGNRDIRKTNNFMVVMVSEGIGTGIVFDGQIYRGEKGAAGEFGHMIVGENSPAKCSCGSSKCWEGYASEKAIVAIFNEINGNKNRKKDVNQVFDLAIEGNQDAIQVLQETTKYLGIGIANLIVGLSPQAVIVSGRITKVWHLIVDDLIEMTKRSIRSDLSQIKLLSSSLGDYPTLVGALSLVLAKKFASE